MDFSELTRIIFNRIQKLEPENAIRILGCLFLNEPGEEKMIQLAFGPDEEIQAIIVDAKATLSILSSKLFSARSVPSHQHQFGTFSSDGPRFFSSAATIHVPSSYLEPQLTSGPQPSIHSLFFAPHQYSDSFADDHNVHNQAQFLSLEEHMDRAHSRGPESFSNYYCQEDDFAVGMSSRTSRSPSLPEFSFKACHYFQKGYCKHGANCRYFHGQSIPDTCSLSMANEDHIVSPRSLQKLELEIIELLKEKRGVPMSIASLPMLYFEKYGRNLQAEGYLTESQRHGKVGFSLTKLLARLKNSIRLIDRPHGQHSIILAEDAPRYMAYINENENHDPGATAASSHQIYLTFPPDSTFTEEDVSNYFKQFGPVHDVRIPCQDKRMFGFVSFVHPETVRTILSKRNPHYISGARVLVKPYKEKSRIIDRANLDKIDPAMHYPHYLEMDPVLCAMQRESGRSRLLRWQQMQEQEKLAALERRRLSELNLSPKPDSQRPYFSNSLDELEISEAPNEFLTADHFSYPLDSLNNEFQRDDKSKPSSNDQGDQESGQIDLPESPFASPEVGSSISGVL